MTPFFNLISTTKNNPTIFSFQPTPPTNNPKIKPCVSGKTDRKSFLAMNRGVLQSSPVQQMVAGNPNWWSMNSMRPPPPVPSHVPSSSSFIPQYPTPPSLPLTSWLENQELPDSWSQLLMGGLMGEEERCSYNNYQVKKMGSWEDQMLIQQSQSGQMADVKQESSDGNGFVYPQNSEDFHGSRSSWARVLPVSSPTSTVTSFSVNILDFSNTKQEGCQQQADHSTECNSTSTGAAFKKARVQPSAQSTFKVRKEKLGDRITALHQLVSPFGKTDTASVLLEAIGYIRFLQSQIEALSMPYMGGESGNLRQSGQGERNCIFPEDPGQLLNESGIKRRSASDKEIEDEPKRDLRSRGLCLVPVSCTLQVGSDNGADYWAPSLGGGFR